MLTKTVYLSLGSNLGDRATTLRTAVERLRELGELRAVSAVYETEPVDFRDQPWFYNCAVELTTTLMPMQLLARLQQIELDLGRQRLRPKGPRTLDVDILLFARAVVNAPPKLVIPHLGLHQRRFVLIPLVEIAPDLRHPVLRRTMRELLAALPPSGQAVKRVGRLEELPGASQAGDKAI
jgi:2-amino-4-hydroxy-6-hydroxymethyldihydropteridine diphosphokinase